MTPPRLTEAPSSWSVEARVLRRPAATYRQLAGNLPVRRARWPGKLLLLAFMFGATSSALASGQFNVRLIVDGMIAFAFVPIAEWIAFAAVYWHATRSRRTIGDGRVVSPAPPPFAAAFDLFLSGNSPWLLWMIAVSAIGAVVPPRDAGSFLLPLILGSAIPALWAAWIDFHFFRDVLHRSRLADAVNDLIVNRIICWTATIGYFFGIAIWYEIIPLVHERIATLAGAL